MNYSLRLVISLVLTMSLSAALADSQHGKPGKNSGSLARQPHSPRSGNTNDSEMPCCDKHGQTLGSAVEKKSTDQERDQDRERDREHNPDADSDNPGQGNERSQEMLERRDERKEAEKPWYEFWK